MPEPTGHDAAIYVQLLATTQEEYHARARRWVQYEFEAQNFKELEEKYPPKSDQRDRLVTVMAFYESIGVLVSRGLLHEDVFFDGAFAFDTLWPKLKGVVEEWQKAAGNPAAWENFYWLGQRLDVWRRDRWKPKSEMVPPERGPLEIEPHVTGFAR